MPDGMTFNTLIIAIASILIGVITMVIWRHSHERAGRDANLALFLLVFAVITAGIASIGVLSYSQYERQFRVHVENELISIAALKVNEIESWRDERMGDAAILYQNKAFSALVARYLAQPDDQPTNEELHAWLDRYQVYNQYDKVILLDAAGQERLVLPETDETPEGRMNDEAITALHTGKIIFLDFHRDTPEDSIHLATLIPILDNATNQVLAVLVLRINPYAQLYPSIHQWPGMYTTADTLLVRRDGNEALLLNELRSHPNSAMVLRTPLEKTDRPIVKAALGEEGIVTGVNHSGNQILAVSQRVQNSPWMMVAQVDANEVYMPLRERMWGMTAFFGLLMLSAGSGLALIWRHQRLNYYRDQAAAARALRESEERFRKSVEEAPLPMMIHADDGRVIAISSAWSDISGYSREDIPTIDDWIDRAYDARKDDIRPLIKTIYHRQHRHLDGEYSIRCKNGAERIWEFSSVGLGALADGRRIAIWMAADTTERKRNEELVRARLHLLDFSTDHTLEEVLRKTLDQITELTGSAIGFYHFVEPDQKTLSLQSWSTATLEQYCHLNGSGMHYPIDHAGIWVDCVRERKPVIHNDYASVPHRKGMPANHAPLTRELVVPVIRGGLIVAMLGIGNKTTNYTATDVELVTYFADVSWEIAERKRAEQGYQTLFRQMLNGFALHEIICDITGRPINYRFLAVNPAFEHMTGLRGADIVGKTVLDVLPDTEPYWIETYGKVALTGEAVFIENYAQALKKYFEVTAFRPAPNQFACIFADVTERKIQEQHIQETQEKLQQLNSQLEQRVAERTAQLQATNQELEAFAYSVSHDLRAPLRAMEGFSSALLSRYHDQLDDQGQHYLSRIQYAAQRMGQLINDLLNLSRITRSDFSLQPVNLSAIAQEIASELQAHEPQRQVQFRIADSLIVQGDARLLRIALQNLIDNAWKFSVSREPAIIEIGQMTVAEYNACHAAWETGLPVAEQYHADHIIYYVRDNGVGFDMAYAGKLFAPFQRLHATHEFPGTGIGLATVQRVLMRHGGQIWPCARINQGTTFYFTLGG